MQFNSSLLKENSSKDNQFILENSVEKRDKTFLNNILEFNNIMHQIDVEEKINYYRALTEYSIGNCTELVLRENITNSIINLISKAIKAIVDLFNKFINFIRGKSNSDIFKKSKEYKIEFEFVYGKPGSAGPSPDLHQVKELKFFTRPKIDDIQEKYISGSLNNLTSALDTILNGGKITKEFVENAYEMAYKLMSKSIVRKRNTYSKSVIDSSTFKECIMNDSCFTETRSMKVGDYLNENKISSDNDSAKVARKLASIKSTLERYENMLRSREANIDPDNRQLANTILNYCKIVSNDAIWYFNYIINKDSEALNYWNKLFETYVKNVKHESGMIHGEEFNSDTLFDNDDDRDFNRTEWLDLELTTECYELSYAILEYRRRVAINEAMIIAENSTETFKKLVSMQEAEAKELGNKFMEIIQTIITAVDNFFTNLQDKLSLNVKYIQKNKDIIEGKPIKLLSIKSNGDILKGLSRITNKTELAQYNYETMKDSLKDEREFFDKYIKGKLGSDLSLRNGASWSDTKLSVAELCKAYFGASFPEEKLPKVSISTADIETRKKDIIDFLTNPNHFMSNIRSEISSLKSRAQQVASEIKTTNTAPNNATTNNSDNKSGNEMVSISDSMYYSELYGRWITEADIVSPETGNNANGENKQAKSDSKDGFKTYLNTYRSVLLAKLTGAAFIRSELMAIMKAHVKVYDPKRAAEGDDSNKKKEEAPNQLPENNG